MHIVYSSVKKMFLVLLLKLRAKKGTLTEGFAYQSKTQPLEGVERRVMVWILKVLKRPSVEDFITRLWNNWEMVELLEDGA
jgi:hypothetical protein